jgi:tRNA pseudouridine38-40 synthase
MTEELRRRVRLLVAYDGGGFAGFARNEGVETVGGTLEAHLSRVLREPISLTVAGRTDRGVHAWGQVCSFDTTAEVDPVRLRRSLNSLSGGRIVVRRVDVVDDTFDARFSACWRRYRYTVLNRDVPDPFSGHLSWWVPDELDLDAMRQACVPLIGEHDFGAFCRRPKPMPGAETPPSMVRRVIEADWVRQPGDRLRFEVVATAFCHQMVRSLVGTLVAVGRGALHASDVAAILRSQDRQRCPDVAPPQGLCLWEVGYESHGLPDGRADQ